MRSGACWLDEAQLAALDAALEAGPLAAGWQDQRWALAPPQPSVPRQGQQAAHRQLAGGNVVLIWDNLNVRKRAELRAFTSAQPWLRVFWLPAC